MADPQLAMPPLGPGTGKAPNGWFAAPLGPAAYEDPLSEIPDDLSVDAQRMLQMSRVERVLDRMDRDLIALQNVKTRIREIGALLAVDRLRREIGLEANPPTLHMSFTGNPGTGKTTVASRMADLLRALGYLRKGHLVTVTREDLVGQYVGHTAPKTREVLKRAMGGVLFIDEAYHLYRLDNERDYGQETVEMLLQAMENEREDLVVILAGYREKMERFFDDVPGLSSRIAHHIEFPDYTQAELIDIANLMLVQQRYRFSSDAETAFARYLERRIGQPRFANGRSVRNALERTRMRHATRIYEVALSGRGLTKQDLVTIQAEDILRSRVLQEQTKRR
jgi:probable Rubsico expression protein CbbX